MSGQFSRKDFLEAIFQNYFNDHEGFIVVQAVTRHDPRVSTRYFPNIDTLVKEQYSKDQNVLFGVCPRERMKPGLSNITYVPCLWAGLDFTPDGHSGREGHFVSPAFAARAVRSFPLPPSIIVESGAGLHLYWLLSEVVSVDDHNGLGAMLRKVNDFFKCKRKVDLDATLRLPETTNCKVPGQYLDCKLKYMNQDFRYRLEDFERIDLNSQSVTAIMGHQPQAERREDVQSASHEAPVEDDPATETDVIAIEIIDEYLARDEAPAPGGEAAMEASESEQEPGPLVSDQALDKIADRIVDKILSNLTEDLADRIAERILSRMSSIKREGKP